MDLTHEQKALRRVVCAANRFTGDGSVILIGPRHWDGVMRRQLERFGGPEAFGAEGYGNDEWEQGFIDQWGNFLTRNEAWRVASRHGQIKHLVGSQFEMIHAPSVQAFLEQELDSSNLY